MTPLNQVGDFLSSHCYMTKDSEHFVCVFGVFYLIFVFSLLT